MMYTILVGFFGIFMGYQYCRVSMSHLIREDKEVPPVKVKTINDHLMELQYTLTNYKDLVQNYEESLSGIYKYEHRVKKCIGKFEESVSRLKSHMHELDFIINNIDGKYDIKDKTSSTGSFRYGDLKLKPYDYNRQYEEEEQREERIKNGTATDDDLIAF